VADALLRGELRPVFAQIPGGGTVLDVGAGSGNRALLLARAGYRVSAVEPDAVEAEHARTQLAGLATVHACTIEALPADEREYDGAVLSHVLEHLAEPDAALAATRDRLAPGGRAIVFVPNAGSCEARLFRGRWHGWEPARHRWHYTARTLTRALTDAGYVDVAVHAQGGWRYPATLSFSLLPQLDPQLPGGPSPVFGRVATLALSPLAAVTVLAGCGPQLVATGRRAGGATDAQPGHRGRTPAFLERA
jgi:SAM-dependent methyltransferase